MLDKNTITSLKKKWVNSVKVFFYDAWCSWNKIDLEEEPNISDLILIKNQDLVNIYSTENDFDLIKNWIITRVIKADHTWKEQTRYVFSSKEIKDRCGCWTSFSFEMKKPKINLDKLRALKLNFKTWI